MTAAASSAWPCSRTTSASARSSAGPRPAWERSPTSRCPGPATGRAALDLMRRGASAPDALGELLSGDEQEAVRQVAMVDRHGRVAVHTGSAAFARRDIAWPTASRPRPTSWSARRCRTRWSRPTLRRRESWPTACWPRWRRRRREGGDMRGRQSAALLRGGLRARQPRSRCSTCAWRTTRIRWPSSRGSSPRAAPTAAWRRATSWPRAATSTARSPSTAAAHEAQPDNAELAFWHGVALAASGREEEARPLLEAAYREPRRLARAAAAAARRRAVPRRPRTYVDRLA